MLSEHLQAEITRLLEHFNAAYEKLRERADHANFEPAYDHTLYSDHAKWRMISDLLWHDYEQVGKLTIRFEHYQHKFNMFGNDYGVWEPIGETTLLLFSALSRSDAIRKALEKIETEKTVFNLLCSSETPEVTV